ncbi:fibronectin type III domain-containing protein [Hymenobacter terricola]|uniref:fibronectin type III domain-containing protein n=1 Tax=Hymenobacter terricola TaxID=2819236 RepID=UPI001B312763|nr:fibronectin type III domain-containing protein [Hymenobacter terricola]
MQHFFSLKPPGTPRRRGWLALLWLLGCGTAAVAQTTVIGSTTVPVVAPAVSSYLYGPIYRSATTSTFDWSRYAHLYTPTELNIPTGAVITELAWLKSDAGELTGNNVFNVLLDNSALTTLGTTMTWGALTTTATSVYASTTQQFTGAAGTYVSVTLSQPFVYTGGNLLVLTDHQKLGVATAAVNFVTNLATGFGLGYANSAALTSATALTTTYGNRRPTLRVTYTPGGPCTAPPTAGTTAATATTVCAGTAVGLSLLGSTYGSGQTYQWQESTNGTTFTDITGATATTYTVASVLATRTYRARLTCSGQSATSTPVTVSVNAASYASLPIAESFENAWIDACASHDVPTNSWRNTPTAGDASWRRDDDGTVGSWTSPTVGVYAPLGSQGSHSARFHSYYAPAAATGSLDLYVNLSATGNKVLQFDYLNTAGNDSLQVRVSTDGGVTFGAPLLRLGISGTVAQGWQPQSVSLTSTSATTIVRFRTKVTATFTSDIGLDNVRLDVLTGVPNCATSFVPATGATGVVRTPTITWNSGGGVATGYDVYFGTTATPPLVVTNQPGTSYTPAALAATTTYYYKIVPRNANGAATGCVTNSFTTTSTYTYCNSGLGDYCGTADIVNVTVAGSGLNNSGTTCNSANGSSYTSYPASGTATGTLLRGLTYQLSVTTSASAIISAWIDFNQNGTFEATEWTQVAVSSTTNAPATVSITIPVGTPLGQTGLRIRSRSTGNTNGAADACTLFGSGEAEDYIITIGAAPACAPAAGLAATNVTTTTATLSFSTVTNGTAANYVVQYGLSGFTPGGTGSTTVNTTTTSTAITGLTANTTYQFYVTKDCGSGQSSQIAGPFTFRTACVATTYATLPVIESFENTWVGICDTRDAPTAFWRNTPMTGDASWRREDDGASAAWTSPTIGGYTPTGSQGTHSARFHSYYAPAGSAGILDLYVNLSTAGSKRLSFDYLNTAGNDSLYVQVSNDGGNTFGAPQVALGVSGTVAQGWIAQVTNLTGTSATTVVRFRTKVTGTFTSDIGIDNLRIELASGCLSPANLTAVTTQTTAVLSWLNSGAGTYTVVYGPTGFNPATGGTTVAGITGTSTTVTGLTPGTPYQFYVTQNCAAGVSSGQAGPAAFSTLIPNDDCAGAINAPVQFGTCVGQTSADNTAATASTGVPAPGCANYVGQDVWFKVTVPASGTVTVETVPPTAGSSITDTGLAIYSGACATLALVNCDDDSSPNGLFSLLTVTGRTPGEILYLRVWAYGSNNSGLLAVCVTSPSNCSVPTGPTASNLTNTTATLNWVPGGTPAAGTTYELEYGLQGFVQGTGTAIIGLTTPTRTITGLLPNTAYCYYVRQNCGTTNGSSAFVGPTCFTTPLTIPGNDEPCGAIGLGTTVLTSSNVGATTSVQNGINLPACSSAQLPKDVWFTITPTGTSTTLTLTGTPAGMVRLYTSPNCSAGPFTSVFCAAATAANTGFTAPIPVTGLTAGTRYYVAVSGYGSSDATGSFTLAGTNLAPVVTATQAKADTNALLVYPNPSSTGQLTLALNGLNGPGRATLLNALGQVVREKALTGTTEQTLTTRGLATGIYTLRVAVAGQVLTRKVVLE